jgi:hypothetical protein
MDSVRFGRALGIGARAAAKTLVTAVDAATSPNPSAGAPANQSGSAVPAAASAATTASDKAGPAVRLVEQAARTTVQVRQTGQGLKEGSKRFGEAAWGPLAKASGALWLEFTGVFFGIFALFAANGAWKTWSALHKTGLSQDANGHLLISLGMAAVFSYFCVSSFVKANRRSKGSGRR